MPIPENLFCDRCMTQECLCMTCHSERPACVGIGFCCTRCLDEGARLYCTYIAALEASPFIDDKHTRLVFRTPRSFTHRLERISNTDKVDVLHGPACAATVRAAKSIRGCVTANKVCEALTQGKLDECCASVSPQATCSTCWAMISKVAGRDEPTTTSMFGRGSVSLADRLGAGPGGLGPMSLSDGAVHREWPLASSERKSVPGRTLDSGLCLYCMVGRVRDADLPKFGYERYFCSRECHYSSVVRYFKTLLHIFRMRNDYALCGIDIDADISTMELTIRGNGYVALKRYPYEAPPDGTIIVYPRPALLSAVNTSLTVAPFHLCFGSLLSIPLLSCQSCYGCSVGGEYWSSMFGRF
ncbi:hypothetical protein F4679DRAFT_222406 [Xylaria curta]|nr:hypothetical protein F4679DRAFT_222406 [Xylaria curta]